MWLAEIGWSSSRMTKSLTRVELPAKSEGHYKSPVTTYGWNEAPTINGSQLDQQKEFVALPALFLLLPAVKALRY